MENRGEVLLLVVGLVAVQSAASGSTVAGETLCLPRGGTPGDMMSLVSPDG